MKYEIKGDNLPVVICHLEKGESMITDSGAMSWMDPVMEMETTSGGFGKAFGRMFSGETMFQNLLHLLFQGQSKLLKLIQIMKLLYKSHHS